MMFQQLLAWWARRGHLPAPLACDDPTCDSQARAEQYLRRRASQYRELARIEAEVQALQRAPHAHAQRSEGPP